MKYKFLNLQGLERFLQKIKSSIPTKTSELQNDSGYITSQGAYDSALSDSSEKAVQNKVIKKALDDKADTGHTHVSSEITDLSIPSKTSELTNDSGFITGVSWNDVSSKPSSFTPTSHTHVASEVSGLSTVATSGSYNDLSNKPSIPSKTSDLTNDSGFLTSHNPVDSALSSTSTNAVQNKVINTELGKKANTTDLATVAISGSYADLSNKPSIPSKTSDLTNDSGFLTSHNPVDSALSSTSTNAVQNKVVKAELDNKSDTGHKHTVSDVTDFPTLSAVATSGSYNDLSNKPTIPTVYNKTLTIQQNGTTVKTFTTNSNADVTANITVPTKTSDLTNDSGFLTSHNPVDSALSTTSENAVQNKVVKAELDLKANSADLSTVATTGSYTDLNNIPSNFTPASHTHGSITNDGKLGTASRALITDGNKKIAVSSVTSTELGYLSGVTSAVQDQLDGKAASTHSHTASEVSGLATVATSGSYNDLTNKPTIPTVNNATLTIQKNGTTVKTFTANASSNVTANITVPTKVSELTNDSGFLTAHNPVDSALSDTSTNAVQNKVVKGALDGKSDTGHTHTKSEITDFPTLATVATSGSYNDLSNKPTIPTVNNATLTIQKNGTTVKTFTANASSNVTANITVPTKVSELTNDSGYLTSASNLDSSKLTGTIDIARLPKGALERLVTVADQTARFALTTSDVQLGDTVKQLDTGVMYIVTDESKLSSADGYTEYTAGAATSVPWSGVTGKPSSYTPASHSHGNIASGGTLGTASRALITDGNKKITTSSVTSTELGYVSGVTSAIQTQLNGKAASSHTHTASEVSGLSTVATSGSYSDLSNKPTIDSALSSTSTNAVQNKVINSALAGKAASSHTHTKSQITDFPTKTSQFTNDSHQTITVGTDTTSTASPAHSGTFTCIDSVTRDSNGHVTAVNTKTVTLPSDNNTDTLVTQNVSTANENHPVLLTVTKDATANQGAKTSIFASGVKVNPSTNTVTATTFSGALSGNASSATQFSANKSVTLTGDVTGTASSKAGWSVATTLSDSGVTAGTYGPSADVTGNNNATISVPEITVDSKGRVTSVANRTLTCKNNTYNVYNKTLTIQKNGTSVATFTSNSNTDVTANITVPTKTSELTNDSGYLTSHQSLSNYVTLNGSQTISGNKTFTGNIVGTDITGQTIDINTCVSTTAGACKIYYCTTTGGANNFTNKPVGQAFILYSRTPRYVSSTDYIYEQIAYGALTIYFRTCTNGTWTGWKQFSTTDHTHSQYLTAHQSLANYSTLANTIKSLSISGKTITYTKGDNTTGTLTTQDNNTWTAMVGATSSANGSVGYVNAVPPKDGYNTKYLRADGTWAVPPDHTYTVNNKTLTIQKNGTNVATFTSNSNTNVTANITVPTKTSELTNDSGYLTSHQSLSNYVTLNGAQTISGNKTFTGNVILNEAQLVWQKNLTANYEMTASDFNNKIGFVKVATFKAGTSSAPRDNNGDYDLLSLSSNTAYGTFLCTTPRNDILWYGKFWESAWQGWKEVVNCESAQTISGVKTISTNLKFSSANTRGTAPSAKEERGLIDYVDSAGNRIFLLETVYNTDKSSRTGLYAYKTTTASGGNIGSLAIGCDTSGNVYTQAPTPATADNSTKIATTAFVKAQGYITGTGNTTGSSGSCTGNAATATQFSANKSVTLTGDVTGTASSKAGWSVATTLANSGVTAGTYGPSADVTGNNNATISVPQITVDAKGRVTSVTNRTLTCKNNTYNVYNKTLTIQKNGTNVATFTSNSNTDVTANITVPTKTSELTNDSGYLTSHQSLSNYVTLNGDQTVSGTKTFSAIQYFNEYKLVVKSTNQTVGTTPSSNKWNGMVFQDTAGTSTFTIENGHIKNGSTQLNFGCTPNISGAAKETFLQYYCGTTEGASVLNIMTASATAPTPATSDNSTQIATTAFVKAQGYLTSHQSLSSCVKNVVTNNQTIKSTGITRGTAPSSAQTFGIAFSDNKNKSIGNIYGYYATDKGTYIGLYAYKGTTTSNGDNASVRVGYDASGNAYTYAPTPATTDNSTQIATTAFVKAQGYLTSHQSLANYSTLANTVKSLSISGKTITVTPGSGSDYTLTTQDTVYTHPTTAGNKHIPSGGSSGQILKYSASGTAVWADASFIRTPTSIATRTSTGEWTIATVKNTPIYIVGTFKGNTSTSSSYTVSFTSGTYKDTGGTTAVGYSGNSKTYKVEYIAITSATVVYVNVAITAFSNATISLTAYQ